MSRPLRIGVSACFFHADPQRPVFKGKTLQYVEQSMARWVLEEGALVYVIPSPERAESLALFADDLDGLVLEGGSDVSPTSYGEKPIRPEWGGDRIRDDYESALFREFTARKKPIFGVCRGLQLINVALGGSLYQDIEFQLPDAKCHRDWNVYDQLFHAIAIEPTTWLAKFCSAGERTARVNSVHHQAIKALGQGLVVEAKSESDGIIEAVRLKGESWVYAVQWHPEFQTDPALLDTRPLLREFLKEAQARRVL